MGELRGGTTIAGYTAIHSGLKEVYLSGNLTMGGNITIPANGQIISGYNSAHVFKDFNNGHITVSAAGGSLYLGYQNTARVNLSSNLYAGTSANMIADTSGKLYYQGADADARWLTLNTNPYLSTDLDGSSTYPRLSVKNSGASSPQWLRVGDSTGSYGLLPYSNGNSFLGTSSWKFKEIHGVTIYQNGTALDSLYASAGHNHDSVYVKDAGDTMTGLLSVQVSNASYQLKMQRTGTTPSAVGNIGMTGNQFRIMDDVSTTARLGVDVTNGDTTIGGNLTLTNADWPLIRVSASTVGQDPVVAYTAPGGEWTERNDDSNANVFEWRWNNAYKMRLGTAGDLTITGTLNVISGPDVSLAGGGGIVIGPTTGANIGIDPNELQARNNGAAATLNLNIGGGNTVIGTAGSTTTIGGNLTMSTGSIINVTNGSTVKPAIEFLGSVDGAVSGYGISIGAGGMTIISSGESAAYMRDGLLAKKEADGTTNWTGSKEYTYIGSDNTIFFYPNQNGGFTEKGYGQLTGGDGEVSFRLVNTTASGGAVQNVGFELRGEGGGMPYIDFTRSTNDYDARLYMDSANNLAIVGGGDFQLGNLKTYGQSNWYTADSVGGWVIIAYNGTSTAMATTGGDRAYGKFTIINEDAARHELIQFTAGTAYNKQEGINLKMLGKVMFGSSETFGGIRIMTRGTYDTQYLEVWTEPSVRFRTVMEDNYFNSGWKLLTTPIKSVADGTYTANKLEMQPGYEGIPRNIASGTVAPPNQGMFKGDVYIQY